VARLNEVLYPHTHRTHRFVTLTAAVLDPGRQSVALVNAGHLPSLLYRRATGTLLEAQPREAAGNVLGMIQGHRYQSCHIELQPGDCLLMFTDGVCEAVNVTSKQRILEGIHATLQGGGPYCPRSMGERLVKAVQQHATHRSQQDDVTLVCFGRKE
jgi:sigma-B regulation protein RsbU (phosphoserine phosphatase)